MSAGPDAKYFEDLRQRIFEGSAESPLKSDERASLIFEKICERLQEDADEGDEFEASEREPRRNSALSAQWSAYVASCHASIEKRASLQDAQGDMRVQRVYRSGGGLRQTDLYDWRGRLRVRIAYDGAGDPIEVRLMRSSGVPFPAVHRDNFDFGVGGTGPQTLNDRFGRARRSTVVALKDVAPAQADVARSNSQALVDHTLALIEGLLRREHAEGRQLVPTSEELVEMSLEQVLEHLEKRAQV